MAHSADSNHLERQERFIKNLVAFTKEHRASHWSGPLSEFLEKVLPNNPHAATRTSHLYIWDMIRWQGGQDDDSKFHCKLFDDELFGIDDAIERVVDYFKAAAPQAARAVGDTR